jgi:hypothetical protein
MTIKDTSKQLQIGTDKYVITNQFYSFLIRQTNHIGDYNQCYRFVRNAVDRAMKHEVTKVSSFKRNKIDFEL